jgi:phosphatidylglycerophosphate synthase
MKTMNRRHVRVNNIILGPLERPALEWLAAHMPSRVTPDICTATGLFGALTTAVGYGLSNFHPGFLWLASLGFFINWFGDSLDGTLARYRRIERPLYGYFVDHTTDLVCQVMVFAGMGLSPYVTFNIACLSLVAYLMLSAMVFLRTYAVGEFKISYGGLGPTESRVVAVLLNTAMYFFGVQKIQIAQVMFSIYDVAIGAIGVLLFWFFIDTSIREVRRLAALGK